VPDSELNKKGSIGMIPTIIKVETEPVGVPVAGKDPSLLASENILMKIAPGSRANFSCEAEGLPVPRIEWMKVRSLLSFSLSIHIQYIHCTIITYAMSRVAKGVNKPQAKNNPLLYKLSSYMYVYRGR
jgi:hypothetical protein